MPSHRFTQCVCVLFERLPTADDLDRALGDWSVAGPQQPAPGEDGWMACGPGRVVELRSGAPVIVDLVDRPWPDDPRATSEEPALTAAWRAGWLGPSSAPGALARARAQAWSWDGAGAAAGGHRAFARLRTVGDVAEGPGRPAEPQDPFYELMALTGMAGALLGLPGATALFVPGGEALRSRAQVEAALRSKAGLGPTPVDLWVNLRAVGLGQEGGARWMASDLVGMAQLHLPDQEAIFAEGQEDPEAVARLLLDACQRLVSGKSIAEGSRADDHRGRRWRVSAEAGCVPPARHVLRWLPEQSARPSGAMLARLGPPARAPPP